MTFTSADGRWRLEWVDLGEGVSGDYDPEDPTDTPYLRADLYEQVNGEWTEPRDTSYCTLAPTFTPEVLLKRYADELFRDLTKASSAKRVMQSWTWTTDPRSNP